MADVYDQLAQAQGTGSAATLYTCPGGKIAIVMGIRVVNTTAGPLQFRLYHDASGTTYTAATIIYPLTAIPANSMSVENNARIAMNGAGHIGFNGPAGLTITLYGVVR